jgi:hypothetical protein
MGVEYTFKNSLSEKAFTIILSQTGLMLQSPDREEKIPYEEVNMVKLSRLKDNSFRIKISFDNHRPVVITNKYFLQSGEYEDRSRQYAQFVRVLHLHLKTKSAPVYTSGKSFTLLVIWSIIAAFVAFLVSFISEYLGLSFVNPFIQAAILTALIVSFIFLLNRGKLPREYSPEDIPLQFLP